MVYSDNFWRCQRKASMVPRHRAIGAARRMGGATCPPKLAERRRKAEAILIMLRTTATGFAKRSTHPAILLPDGLFDLPDGQISDSAVICLSSPLCKNILIFRNPNHCYISRRPVPPEGRFAIVTNVARDAVDAGGASDEGASCGRRSRVVLTPRR